MPPENAHFLLYSLCTFASLVVGVLTLKLLRYPKETNGVKTASLLPIIILGAIIGAKGPVIFSYGWHREFFWTGKSYFGALLGAFFALNAYKIFVGQKGGFGDRFVVPLCFSASIGKIGCYLNGCCGGIATNTLFDIARKHGAPTFPVQLYESFFELLCGFFFIWLYRSKRIPGGHFPLYMLLYMLFRFLIEFVRTEPKHLLGLSIYQWMALLFFPLFAFIFFKRAKAGQ